MTSSPWTTAVVEDRLPVVASPQIHELAEQRVLGEPPLEVVGRALRALEGHRVNGVLVPVALDRRRMAFEPEHRRYFRAWI